MTDDFRVEMKRPIPLTLAALAAAGWLLVLVMAALYFSARSEVATVEERARQTQSQLVAHQQAAGSVEEIRGQAASVQDELAAATSERDQVQQELEKSIARLAELQGNIERQTEALQELETRLQSTTQELQSRQTELSSTEERIGEQTRALADVGKRVEEARAEEEASRATVAELTQEAARLAEEASGAEARLQEARATEASIQEQLETARQESGRLTEQRRAVEQALSDLSSRREQLAAEIVVVEQQRNELQQQVASLTNSLDQRSSELAEIDDRLQQLETTEPSESTRAVPALSPGRYEAGQAVIELAEDGSFRMSREGREVTGRYSITDSILTMEEAGGEGGETFSVRCSIQPQPLGFELRSEDDACEELDGVTLNRGRR